MRNPKAMAPVVVAAGVCGVSTAAVLVRLTQAPPLVIAAYRLVLTTLLLTPFWWCVHRREVKRIEPRKGPHDRAAVAWAALAGVCLAVLEATTKLA